MIWTACALLAAQPASQPMVVLGPPPNQAVTSQAEALGREIAENGMLANLLPLVAQRDTEELVAAHPELSAAEQGQLRATSARIFAAGRDRLLTATARAYAQRMSLAQLRRVVAFYRTPAARALREATPAAMIETMQAVAGIDLKRDVQAAFCRDTGRLCEAQR